ncbi:MAG: Plastocyanin [Candidatus Moranbacteria bacterium GW2011_GWC1_45_18]|nr:MAG: Plastocyanin [Candidatus Moranbacteria bacterium GW2011_GWC2_40_12]KKT33793.1 MAG: Plastocyanin [Candidatus Moranbacteria bacterium GW2011_GWF2_44_10]KKT70087.1 MAG: Plastocyanin [Candidatus Moranbacteria bacterium GW2011_GWF1_44_4]KKU00892.1 MAG: Plastocyanin [Candidatus Moranbacteria bacterium GW2011_GWC1_45_18]OGI23459.1 MAG: hypothetical protein A2194_03600 [Candidatus Moranbacteria bacterium RIFOXYA1_FULL_44_8]OGI40328.1 MAG: hypothetical protein A2374_04145 [Candidatus Moranbacte
MEEQVEKNETPGESSSNTNYWIIVIVALIMIIGIIWYAGAKKKVDLNEAPSSIPSQNSQSTSQSTSEVQKQTEAVIEYTDSGFSPQSVTVKISDTVAFTNNSSGEMWVASAPHPVHTDYPELDAKRAYTKGETYSFTFEKTGTWKFHNHLNPTKFGSVTVQ